MSIPESDQRKLCMRSGGRCAFAVCRRVLTAPGPPDKLVVLGQMAHIVAESPDGPRGDSPLTLPERNRYENLILLCNIHHQLIDGQPQTYTVQRLRAIKEEHEKWVESTLGRGSRPPFPEPELVTETVYTTLLPVEHMPPYIYGVRCQLTGERDIALKLRPVRNGEMAPFILREKMLFAFQDLTEHGNPFHDLTNGEPIERYTTDEWWDDPDKSRWYTDLLNRSLNKLTGRRGLHWDKEHKRYYFPCEAQVTEREVSYRPMNQKQASRKVVWQPKRRSTGEARNYWLHRAVGLRFLRLSQRSWALSLRPELRVTEDGIKAPPSELIGRRVTRKMARSFNYDLLGDVQFWRDFLSDSRPRIVMPFGSTVQHVRISTNLMEGDVEWPGMPEEYARPFRNAQYTDDLFSYGELIELTFTDEDDEFDDDDDT